MVQVRERARLAARRDVDRTRELAEPRERVREASSDGEVDRRLGLARAGQRHVVVHAVVHVGLDGRVLPPHAADGAEIGGDVRLGVAVVESGPPRAGHGDVGHGLRRRVVVDLRRRPRDDGVHEQEPPERARSL
jgi:hypothetical protein